MPTQYQLVSDQFDQQADLLKQRHLHKHVDTLFLQLPGRFHRHQLRIPSGLLRGPIMQLRQLHQLTKRLLQMCLPTRFYGPQLRHGHKRVSTEQPGLFQQRHMHK